MGTVSWIPLLVALVVAMVAIVALTGVTMAISLRLSNWGVVDTFWGLGFVVIALSSFLISINRGDPGRRLVALLVPMTWGLRLAGYLHWRNPTSRRTLATRRCYAGGPAY